MIRAQRRRVGEQPAMIRVIASAAMLGALIVGGCRFPSLASRRTATRGLVGAPCCDKRCDRSLADLYDDDSIGDRLGTTRS